jgi:23S rRNA (cytidine1920-2'-O)/16S rRNA (cytidine1409-2'-O)-methyltransferase
VESRTEARRAIEAGLVRVGANTDPKPSTMVSPEESLHIVGSPEPFVSRAGRKLDAALAAWDIDINGVRAIDVGASTGGFTDCLLQRGASSVTAVDVGYGQMHWRIRQDDRVTVVERTNIRTVDTRTLGEPFDLVVADLSFISLTVVAPSLARLGTRDATWVLLIKPQFEAGKGAVDRDGVLRDPAVRREAVQSVVAGMSDHGLGCQKLTVSSITGATGNNEFVALFTRAPRAIDEETIRIVNDQASS